ncbi:hypothetical protein Fmac_024161 [Flemingia macrophylla]|uniref:Protein SIEVE ELEMENT OCCLUSION B n=1 Tax=Flemingia macrophylla TaxID=520843 RepID=A0ABD1LNR0_9FABA
MNVVKSLLHIGGNENNPLAMSDEQILEQIYTTHVHSDTKFDVESLFTLVENTLRRTTIIGSHEITLEHIDDKIPQFDSPLCTLKQICSEMSCKPPTEEIAHKTTLSILNKLSTYEWDEKAVLTLAAFALEYSDFWLLAQYQPTDPIAKSVAILKRVPILTRPLALQKHRQAILELNNLVKTTLQVIQLIFRLEKLTTYNTKVVPALGDSIAQIPVNVYWAIITIVAVVTQFDCLLTESGHKQELSHYGQKINIILSKLRKQITLCEEQIETVEYHRKLEKSFQTPTEVMEVVKLLISYKNARQTLYDGATKTTVDIGMLKRKNVYLFLSSLDITEEDISVVRRAYDSFKTNNQYKIVWIPMVEEWTEQLRKRFDILKSQMPWFVMQHPGRIAGYNYIKEEWQFKNTSMVVALNPQGKVENKNAFPLIQAYGEEAFPFTDRMVDEIHRKRSGVGVVLANLFPKIKTSMNEHKYILIYGGKEREWIQQFTKHANAIANDATLKDAKIYIDLFSLEKEEKSLEKRFWSGIESLFVTMVHKTVDAATQEVQKILSYKNESGWAFLCKGPAVVESGHGNTMLKTLAEFGSWKEDVIKKSFEYSFKEFHDKIEATTHRCSHLEIHNVVGKLPETIKCPECPKAMQIFITYKCCHNENTTR